MIRMPGAGQVIPLEKGGVMFWTTDLSSNQRLVRLRNPLPWGRSQWLLALLAAISLVAPIPTAIADD